MRADDHVVVLDHEIADRRRRHVESQRLPVVAIVERDPDLRFPSGEEQALPPRIFPHRVHGRAAVDAGHDLRPGRAAVARAVDVRPQVVQAKGVHRGVGREGIGVRGIDQRDLAPRPRAQPGGGHVLPCRAAIHRHVNEAVVRASPDHALRDVRWRDRIDDAWMPGDRSGRRAVRAHARRHDAVAAREVGRQLRPAAAAVHGAPDHVAREVERARIHRGEEHRCRSQHAVVGRAKGLWRDLLDLARAPVPARHPAAVDDIRVERVGSDVAVLLHADRCPLAEGDGAVVAAALHARRARLLLPAADAIREGVVGADVVELRGRLVVPRAPRAAAVDGDDDALVARVEDDVRVVRVDPEPVVVVAPGRAAQRLPRDAGVRGLPGDDGGAVDDVGVLWIDLYFREIRRPRRDARVARGTRPVLARVVRAVDVAGALHVGGDVDSFRIARREPDADAPESVGDGRQALRQLPPRGAAVHRLEEPAAGTGEDAVLPRRLAILPERGICHIGIRLVDDDVDAPRVLVAVQHLRERSPAVGRPEDAALGVGPVGMAEHGDEDAVRVARVDRDLRDLLPVAQAEVRPGGAGVARAVDAVAGGEVGTLQALAAPYI